MIELDNFNFDEEVAKFNDVIFNQSNEVKAKILTGYLSSLLMLRLNILMISMIIKQCLKILKAK